MFIRRDLLNDWVLVYFADHKWDTAIIFEIEPGCYELRNQRNESSQPFAQNKVVSCEEGAVTLNLRGLKSSPVIPGAPLPLIILDGQ